MRAAAGGDPRGSASSRDEEVDAVSSSAGAGGGGDRDGAQGEDASQADWPVVHVSDTDRLYFDAHQWDVVEAASARIIPADHDPGAREAGVVRFIDRYLAGHVYAAADGNGFLQQTGKAAQAWAERTAVMQRKYTEGVEAIERIAIERSGRSFTELDDSEQDAVLEQLSGRPKPAGFVERLRAEGKLTAAGSQRSASGVDLAPADEGGAPPSNQPVPDDALDFFPMLLLHVRQGFYADPAYGGNRNRIGWDVIGFPGPTSLGQTQRGEFSTNDYLLPDAVWPYADGL